MNDFLDIELINKVQKGDEKALEFLIQRYLNMIYGFIFKYVKNKDEAEDITQEVFLKMWKNIGRFDRERNFKTWLFSIAKNTVIDFFKKKKTVPFSILEGEFGESFAENIRDDSPLPSDIFEKDNFGKILNSALEKISYECRAVILLYHKELLNFREISESLKTPINTIKSRYRRGIHSLRKILAKQDITL